MSSSWETAVISRLWLGLLGFFGFLRGAYEPVWAVYLMFVCAGLILFRPKRRREKDQGRKRHDERPRAHDEALKVLTLPLVRPPSPWGPF